MKKVFLALAVVAMFSFVACNGNSEAQDTTTAPEATVVEEPVQEPACDEATAETMTEDAAAETEAAVAE